MIKWSSVNIFNHLRILSLNMSFIVIRDLCRDSRMLQLTNIDSGSACERMNEVCQLLKVVRQVIALSKAVIELFDLLLFLLLCLS